MSAAEALKAGRAAGIRLGIDGDALTLEASEAPSPAVLDPLARRKASLVAVLRLGDVGWSCGDWLVRSPPGRSPRAAVEHATLCCPFGTEPTDHGLAAFALLVGSVLLLASPSLPEVARCGLIPTLFEEMVARPLKHARWHAVCRL
jgi:hypothetical protein